MNSYLQDEEELQPLDEEAPAPRPKPRWWEVAGVGAPPNVDADAPVPSNVPMDSAPGAMPEGPKSVPGPVPVDERVRQKTAELESAVGAKPKEGQPKWWQRVAAGAAGFGAGYVNADGKNHPQIDASGAVDTIMGGPQKRQRLSDWHDKVAAAQLGLGGAEKERDAWFKGRQANSAEAASEASTEHTKAMTAGIPGQAVTSAIEHGGEVAPDKPAGNASPREGSTQIIGGKQVFFPSKKQQTTDKKLADEATWRPLPEEITQALKMPAGFKVPIGEFDSYVRLWENKTKTTPEKSKDVFQGIIKRVASEGGLPQEAFTNVGKLSAAIKAAKTISEDEKSVAQAYLAANTTPAATGSNTTIRVEGMQQARENAVIDTHHNNALVYANSAEINAANKETPGRFVPAGPGVTALNKNTLLEDIRGSIGQTRESLAAIPEFRAEDKVAIAMALSDRDPRSAVSQLIGGVAGGHLSPAQQQYIINLAQLHEQAMAMRSVLGAGQGSDELRAAIKRTIPGPGTPNKAYAAKQLDAFEQTLGRLSRGVPTVPLKPDSKPAQTGSGGRGNPVAPAIGDIQIHEGHNYKFDGKQWVLQAQQ